MQRWVCMTSQSAKQLSQKNLPTAPQNKHFGVKRMFSKLSMSFPQMIISCYYGLRCADDL